MRAGDGAAEFMRGKTIYARVSIVVEALSLGVSITHIEASRAIFSLAPSPGASDVHAPLTLPVRIVPDGAAVLIAIVMLLQRRGKE